MEKVIYIRTPFTDHGGATVRIFADHALPLGADIVCEVQVTHCSQKTPFSRREGRKFVLEKTPVKMQVSELPKKMRRIARRVLKLSGVRQLEEGHPPVSPIRTMYENDWSWVMQAFMPKLPADCNAGLIRRVPRPAQEATQPPGVVQEQQPIEPRGGGSGNDRMMMLIGDPGVF